MLHFLFLDFRVPAVLLLIVATGCPSLVQATLDGAADSDGGATSVPFVTSDGADTSSVPGTSGATDTTMGIVSADGTGTGSDTSDGGVTDSDASDGVVTDSGTTAAAESSGTAGPGVSTDGATTTGIPGAVCGNGVPEDGEDCDDDDSDELDGCTSSCVLGPTGMEYGAQTQTQLLGGSSSFAAEAGACAAGEVVIGFRVMRAPGTDDWIRRIRPRCQALALTNEDPTQVVRSGGVTSLNPLGSALSIEGDDTLDCPDDEVVIGYSGGAGSVMDSLSVHCGTIDVVGNPGAYTLSVTPSSVLGPAGAGGGAFGPEFCAAGGVPTAVDVTHGDWLYRIRYTCTQVALTYP